MKRWPGSRLTPSPYNCLMERRQKMLHVVKLIERRFPNAGNRVVASLLALSASALAVGIGILLLKK
jgi:hypothetical protein